MAAVSPPPAAAAAAGRERARVGARRRPPDRGRRRHEAAARVHVAGVDPRSRAQPGARAARRRGRRGGPATPRTARSCASRPRRCASRSSAVAPERVYVDAGDALKEAGTAGVAAARISPDEPVAPRQAAPGRRAYRRRLLGAGMLFAGLIVWLVAQGPVMLAYDEALRRPHERSARRRQRPPAALHGPRPRDARRRDDRARRALHRARATTGLARWEWVALTTSAALGFAQLRAVHGLRLFRSAARGPDAAARARVRPRRSCGGQRRGFAPAPVPDLRRRRAPGAAPSAASCCSSALRSAITARRARDRHDRRHHASSCPPISRSCRPHESRSTRSTRS